MSQFFTTGGQSIGASASASSEYSASNEYSGLTSFKMDWFDLFAVQRTLKSLLQHHSSKASILWRSAFFMVQLSHPYMTTGKTIALTRQTLGGKVNSSSYPPSKKQNLIFHKEVRTLWDPQGHTVLHPSQINTSLWTQRSLPLGMESSRTPFSRTLGAKLAPSGAGIVISLHFLEISP